MGASVSDLNIWYARIPAALARVSRCILVIAITLSLAYLSKGQDAPFSDRQPDAHVTQVADVEPKPAACDDSIVCSPYPNDPGSRIATYILPNAQRSVSLERYLLRFLPPSIDLPPPRADV